MLKYTVVSLIAAFIVIVGCKTHYPLAGKAYTVIQSPTSFERGQNIAYNVCAGCHYDEAVGKFIGMPYTDMPKIAGRVYSANLTSSKMYGVLAQYTDAEFAYLLRTGITRDGRFVPFMLRPTMAEDDINDLIVYFHSKVPAVAAGDTSVGQTHINFIGRMGMRAIAKPQPVIEGIKRPATDDAVGDGRYLVNIIGCYHCHSQSIKKLSYTMPEQSKGYLQGGMKLKSDNGKVRAANLTPDKATGIGNYTKDEFRQAIMSGKARDGHKLRPPMPRFTHLTDQQVSDIYTYLMSRPAVSHAVKN